MTFNYNIRFPRPQPLRRGPSLQRGGEQEQLTKMVQGLPASDIEERFSRSLAKLEIPFSFRMRISSYLQGAQKLSRNFTNMKGEIEIDHLVQSAKGVIPVFIDGQISHFFVPYQADADREKTELTDEFGAKLGWRPSVRIPYWKLLDQDMSDRTLRELV